MLLLLPPLRYNPFCFILSILSATDTVTPSPTAFDTLIGPVRADFHEVLAQIKTRADSKARLVTTITEHLFTQGGKRLRPLMLLLCARACAYPGKAHITLATVIEYIHTATLLHDDVVDNSHLRRGKPTAHTHWGNEAAILVGDFLYSRAFQLMTQVSHARVMQCFADTTNCLAEGEAQQLLNRHNPEISQPLYLAIIRAKTAKLFETAAQLGGILANVPPAVEVGLAQYGLHVGTAFQIVDDILDYGDTSAAMGKNPLQDLQEGKVTLPLIYLYEQGSSAEKNLIRTTIMTTTPSDAQLNTIKAAIQASDAIPYAYHLAEQEIEQAVSALDVLSDTPFKTAAIRLAHFARSRLQ
jgi:octaprenyl-diphosphate synthase